MYLWKHDFCCWEWGRWSRRQSAYFCYTMNPILVFYFSLPRFLPLSNSQWVKCSSSTLEQSVSKRCFFHSRTVSEWKVLFSRRRLGTFFSLFPVGKKNRIALESSFLWFGLLLLNPHKCKPCHVLNREEGESEGRNSVFSTRYFSHSISDFSSQKSSFFSNGFLSSFSNFENTIREKWNKDSSSLFQFKWKQGIEWREKFKER